MRGGGQSGGGSGGGGGNFGESRGFQHLFYGSLSFDLDFNCTAGIVKLLDREISLRETNLILVDSVDTPSGPTIVDQRWIDVPIELDDQVDSIRALISRSPELFVYLQCDKRLSDPSQQAMIAIICNQMRRSRHSATAFSKSAKAFCRASITHLLQRPIENTAAERGSQN